jgi:hypothetical protein
LTPGSPGLGDRKKARSVKSQPEGAESGPVTVLSSDPRRQELEAAGMVVVGESWGARLFLTDDSSLEPARASVAAAVRRGFLVGELDETWAPALAELERDVEADYPATPATAHSAAGLEETRRLWLDRFRVYGVVVPLAATGVDVTPASGHHRVGEWISADPSSARLVAVTVIGWIDGEIVSGRSPEGPDGFLAPSSQRRAETEFTSVARAYRRQGLSIAVKGASIVAFASEGASVFGTGGAAVNAASIAMNESLGYVLTERWISYETPGASA